MSPSRPLSLRLSASAQQFAQRAEQFALGARRLVVQAFVVALPHQLPQMLAVGGGMLTSTFLTLLVIPVVYVVFSALAGHARKAEVAAPEELAAGEGQVFQKVAHETSRSVYTTPATDGVREM